MTTEVHRLAIEVFREERELVAAVRDLLDAFYVDPDLPLEYAIAREASHVYVARSRTGELVAVFFARWPELIATTLPLVGYLGLTVATRRIDDTHPAHLLWNRYLEDARVHVGAVPALLWYRTGTPFGLVPVHRLFLDGEPRIDGTFTPAGARLVAALRQASAIADAGQADHPFVVRGLAAARYLPAESRRAQTSAPRAAARLIRELDLDEARGDRLLCVGWLP